MQMLALLLGMAALTGAQERQFVADARQLLGVRYELGGRLKKHQGVDCQGILFFAAERLASASGRTCGWKSFDVMPSTAIPRGELGTLVQGPVRADRLDVGALRPADIVWLLAPETNPREPASARMDGVDMWVWHTGMVASVENGTAVFLNADPFTGVVMEMDLRAYMEAHGYAGVLITRMQSGPAPARCRRHARMNAPVR